MASLILLAALALYCIWSLRRIIKRRKENRGKCSGCPYVGDNMMLHCGDPIFYTNLNTSYWQSHFYAYARPP